MTRRLFFSHHSPPSRGAYMVVKALNLDVKLHNVNILTYEYLQSELSQINPQHTVPTLEDGNFTMWDSHAIAGYLVGKYGKDDALYPKDPVKRAVVDQRLHFDTGLLYPTIQKMLHPILFKHQIGIPSQLAVDLSRSYNFLERFLENSTWLAGERLTIADLCCISSISTLEYMRPMNKHQHPNLTKYLQRCADLPYYKEANQVGLDMLGKEIQERLIKVKAAQRRKQIIKKNELRKIEKKEVPTTTQKDLPKENQRKTDRLMLKVEVF